MHHPADQAPLMPELAAPPAPPPILPRLGVWGVLADDALHFHTTDGRCHLQVLIAQRTPGTHQAGPVLATLHYPDHGTPNATAAAAASTAQRLRRGAEVMVTGEGLVPALHHGQPVLALAQVQSIRPIAAVLPQHGAEAHA